MSQPADHSSVRRVLLPNGRAIDMHVCPCCGSELVLPIAWEEVGASHWDVALRCPNCEWLGGGVYGEEAVERFDDVLDRGTETLLQDLRRLVRANMEDEIDRFVSALRANAILPEDF